MSHHKCHKCKEKERKRSEGILECLCENEGFLIFLILILLLISTNNNILF